MHHSLPCIYLEHLLLYHYFRYCTLFTTTIYDHLKNRPHHLIKMSCYKKKKKMSHRYKILVNVSKNYTLFWTKPNRFLITIDTLRASNNCIIILYQWNEKSPLKLTLHSYHTLGNRCELSASNLKRDFFSVSEISIFAMK